MKPTHDTWITQGLIVQHDGSDASVIVSCPDQPERAMRLAERLPDVIPLVDGSGPLITVQFSADDESCVAIFHGARAPGLVHRIATLMQAASGVSTATIEAMLPGGLAQLASSYANLAQFIRQCAQASETDEDRQEFRLKAADVLSAMDSITKTIN